MPTIDLTDDELAAVTAAIRRAVEDDKFPHVLRLDPLRAALGKLEAATERSPAAEGPDCGRTAAPVATWRPPCSLSPKEWGPRAWETARGKCVWSNYRTTPW